VMRLSILPGKERPLQMVRSHQPAAFDYRELNASQSSGEELEEVLRGIYRQPFDMVQGPLYRITMLRRGATDHVLAMAVHHAIADGWSLGVFVQDLATAYLLHSSPGSPSLPHPSGKSPRSTGLPPVPLSHSDWAAAERAQWSPAAVDQRAPFWKAHLSGSQPLWSRHPHTATGNGPLERWVCAVPPDQTRPLREVAARHGATLFSTLLAGFRLALWRWAGCQDLVVGTPVANRNREAVRQTMGYFAGVVPIRGQVDPARNFRDHLKATHTAAIDCFAHAVPFTEIARLLGSPGGPGRHSLFDVRFALQNHPVPDVDLPRLSTRLQMRSTGTVRFDLGCEITESGQELEVVWLYRQSMFSPADLRELNRIFQGILERIGRNPESRSDSLVP
jgi:hypothetical protein